METDIPLSVEGKIGVYADIGSVRFGFEGSFGVLKENAA